MAMDFKSRIRALQASLQQQRVEAMLVAHMPNVRYLCGFTGSSGALLVGPKTAELHTDGRYIIQAKEEAQGARVRIARGSAAIAAITKVAPRKATIAIESEHVTVAQRS